MSANLCPVSGHRMSDGVVRGVWWRICPGCSHREVMGTRADADRLEIDYLDTDVPRED